MTTFLRKLFPERMSVAPRPTFHGYAAATRYRPEWTPAFFVFQAGVPQTKMASITGGGQIYGHEYQAMMGYNNILKSYAPKVSSLVGGGQIPWDPAALAPLLGGQQGTGS